MTSESASPKKVLLVVANPSTSTTTGWPVGFWASELSHAWWEFREAGLECVIASPAGGRVEVDALSDPNDESGYSADDVLSRGFLADPECRALLEDTPALTDLDLLDFDALYVAGGQSPMFTFRSNEPLLAALDAFWTRNRPLAVVCHGTAALLDLRDASGEPRIRGRRMTGFANSEEDVADQVVGQKVMPFRIEDEARALGADFVVAPAFQPHAVRDGTLVTGQQQHSGTRAARLLLELLEGE